jgi:integrase
MCIKQSAGCGGGVELHRRQSSAKDATPETGLQLGTASRHAAASQTLTIALMEPAKSVALLLVLTGLRIGELLARRWKNVNLGDEVLYVTQTVYDGHFDRPKTRRSVRAIPLCREAVSILSALYRSRCEPDHLVFRTQSGKPLCRRNLLQRYLRPTCKKLSLPRITWHGLRHFHATL